MNTGPREWDAQTYDRVSDPQYQWGLEVLERLELDGRRVRDGRGLRLGPGHRQAAGAAARRPRALRRRLRVDDREGARRRSATARTTWSPICSELEVAEPRRTSIFSTATFHWIPDHDRLFSRAARGAAAGRPAGRAVRRRGQRRRARPAIVAVATRPEFADHFQGMAMMWNFATPEETEERLRRAGFDEVRCWLEDKPVQPENPYDFTTTVTMGPHLARLPEEQRRAFAEAVLELEDDPLILNYVRLNIDARRA